MNKTHQVYTKKCDQLILDKMNTYIMYIDRTSKLVPIYQGIL